MNWWLWYLGGFVSPVGLVLAFWAVDDIGIWRGWWKP